MNRKGFTLTELLAMLVVLGILIAVAIPNINGMLAKQRVNQIISDSTNMIETAKVKVAKDRYLKKPNTGECIIYSLDYLNDNGNIGKGPNGGTYNQFDSFVVYTKVGSRYEYYVRLIEEYDNKKYGIEYLDLTSIKALKNSNIKTEFTDIGITRGDTEAMSKLNGKITICSSIKNYYVNKVYCDEVDGKYYDALGNEVSYSQYQTSCINE